MSSSRGAITANTSKRCLITLLILVGIVAAIPRFYDLGRSPIRGDELNFLNFSIQNYSLTALWQNPPWLNQIPFADSIAIVWARIRSVTPDEQTVREPFAIVGWLTVLGGFAWAARRFSLSVGLTTGIWLALLPFHIFQSREAYYYVVGILFTTGMIFSTVDLATRLRNGTGLRSAGSIAWLVWAFLACLSHMSIWAVSAICWIMLLVVGLRHLDRQARTRHIGWMLSGGGLLLLGMSRWIMRAVQEVIKTANSAGITSDTGHIGGAIGWVLPRVPLLFVSGFNGFGLALLVLLFIASAFLFFSWKTQSPGHPSSPSYRYLAWLTLWGFTACTLFIGLVGRGTAKVSYFACILPTFLIFCTATIAYATNSIPGKLRRNVQIAFPVVLVCFLAYPAYQITRLDGKPVPYRLLKQELDSLLEPGSVAIIDRWFEPWNEMLRYAPTNVAVTFTVPDEPYNNYVAYHWREVTRTRIEAGGIDAFIRLTRNHEARAGLWTWPERYFARHITVSNSAAFWLRNHGYAPEQDYETLNNSRMLVDIFYDTRTDAIQRAKATGTTFPVFFLADLPFAKSGPMGAPIRTQQFMDWRVLNATGTVKIVNTTPTPQQVMLEISGVSPVGHKIVETRPGFRFHFLPGQMLTWGFGPITLKPGSNRIQLRDRQLAAQSNPLLISKVQVQPAATTD